MDLWLTGCPNEKSIQIHVWALFLDLIHNHVWVQVQLQYVSCPYLNTHVHIYNIFLNITDMNLTKACNTGGHYLSLQT